MPHYNRDRPQTIREAFSSLTVDDLKLLAALVGEVPTRKGELVDALAVVLEDREKVRALHAGLSPYYRKRDEDEE